MFYKGPLREILLTLLIAILIPCVASAQTGNESCLDCHDDDTLESDDGRHVGVVTGIFAKSVHGDLECIECHTTPGDYEDSPHYDDYTPVDCGECHDDVVADYELSAHFLGRFSNGAGAVCRDCHGAHNIQAVSDTSAIANHANIPRLCGECHTGDVKIATNYVRLPISLPNYLESVHGQRWREGKETAVCSDCHGAHNLRRHDDPESLVHRGQLANTCGQCHSDVSEEYINSIHGQAVALGIEDAPTCTDCHDEHLINPIADPASKTSAQHRARELCGNCHTNPSLLSKYGITEGVVSSYLDSYHGWALHRGSALVASCTDCHNVHDIRSRRDPSSSVHAANVTETCARCHEGSNAAFAQSYTHESALVARGPQTWVRTIYIWLIVVVLGGMAFHNVIVAQYEFKKLYRKRGGKPQVIRWGSPERVQHISLLVSFFGLALTGFALRFPDTWWAHIIGLGQHELFRANIHRTLGVLLMVLSVYHVAWMIATRGGQRWLAGMVPRYWDVIQFFENMAFHLRLRAERPAFRKFDYTQKAEYWAVIWGTSLMALTGLVLWFPTFATRWLPVWAVRVSEVIHFYEAILAVAAIFIWHFFYVIFLPGEYPASTVWMNGRQPESHWREHHRAEYEAAERDRAAAAATSSARKDDGAE